jgi:hypothetical protein
MDFQGWIEVNPRLHHALPEGGRPNSVEEILRSYPVEVRALVPNERQDLIHDDQGTVIRV